MKIKISICKIKDNISFQGRLRYAVMDRIFYKDFKTLIKENISKSNTSVKNMFVPARGASRPYFVIAQLSSEETSQNKTTLELTGI